MNIAIVDDEQTEIDSFRSVIKEYSHIANVEFTVSAFHSAEEFSWLSSIFVNILYYFVPYYYLSKF